MLRKVIAASFVLVLSVGFVFAEEIRGVITKVDGNKITFAKVEGRGKDAKKGEEQTLTTATTVKVVRGKRDKETKKVEYTAVEEGLKDKAFTNISERGVRATIITNDDKKITEIRLMGGRRRPKQ